MFCSRAAAAGLIENAVLGMSSSGSRQSGALSGEGGEPVSVGLGVHEVHRHHY